MANLKNITDLPIAESTEGLNLIVNDNGAAKQIPANEVGAQADFLEEDETHPGFIKNKSGIALKSDIVQADWAETDENSPAFVKNKPVEEWDLDVVATLTRRDLENYMHWDYDVRNFTSYEAISNKIKLGIEPKVRVKFDTTSCINEGSDYYIPLVIGLGRCRGWEYGKYDDNPAVVGCIYDTTYMFDMELYIEEDNSIYFDVLLD